MAVRGFKINQFCLAALAFALLAHNSNFSEAFIPFNWLMLFANKTNITSYGINSSGFPSGGSGSSSTTPLPGGTESSSTTDASGGSGNSSESNTTTSTSSPDSGNNTESSTTGNIVNTDSTNGSGGGDSTNSMDGNMNGTLTNANSTEGSGNSTDVNSIDGNSTSNGNSTSDNSTDTTTTGPDSSFQYPGAYLPGYNSSVPQFNITAYEQQLGINPNSTLAKILESLVNGTIIQDIATTIFSPPLGNCSQNYYACATIAFGAQNCCVGINCFPFTFGCNSNLKKRKDH